MRATTSDCTHTKYTRGQAVRAFGEEGEGKYRDDWMSVVGQQYGPPISGQKEAHDMAQRSQNNSWQAMECIFMKPSQLLKAEVHYAELHSLQCLSHCHHTAFLDICCCFTVGSLPQVALCRGHVPTGKKRCTIENGGCVWKRQPLAFELVALGLG